MIVKKVSVVNAAYKFTVAQVYFKTIGRQTCVIDVGKVQQISLSFSSHLHHKDMYLSVL